MHWLILGGGGIGSAIVQQCLRNGDTVDLVTQQTKSAHDPATVHQISSWDWASVEHTITSLPQLPDCFVSTCGLLWSHSQRPEKRLEDLGADTLEASFRANTLAPMAAVKALSQRLDRQSRLKALVLTAKIAGISDNHLGGWYAYRATKAATNMLVRTTAIEWQRRFPNATIGCYHPGTTDTELSSPFQARVPSDQLKSPEAAAEHLIAMMARLTPETTGRFWHWDGSELPW